MGKIKSKMIKNAANTLVKKGIEFTKDFERNKRILKNTMPSKKPRNQMAGFLSRLKKQEEENKLKMPKSS
jgi:ribosomal protein S17E